MYPCGFLFRLDQSDNPPLGSAPWRSSLALRSRPPLVSPKHMSMFYSLLSPLVLALAQNPCFTVVITKNMRMVYKNLVLTGKNKEHIYRWITFVDHSIHGPFNLEPRELMMLRENIPNILYLNINNSQEPKYRNKLNHHTTMQKLWTIPNFTSFDLGILIFPKYPNMRFTFFLIP